LITPDRRFCVPGLIKLQALEFRQEEHLEFVHKLATIRFPGDRIARITFWLLTDTLFRNL
jgi:hypothetical protein